MTITLAHMASGLVAPVLSMPHEEPDGPSCKVPHSHVPQDLADSPAAALVWMLGTETPQVPVSCLHSQASRSVSHQGRLASDQNTPSVSFVLSTNVYQTPTIC